MTTRRTRDLRRLLEIEAQMRGARVRLEPTGGGHWRIVKLGHQSSKDGRTVYHNVESTEKA